MGAPETLFLIIISAAIVGVIVKAMRSSSRYSEAPAAITHTGPYLTACLACGKMIAFTLPGGKILHVQPRAVDGDMIAMEIVLFDGTRPMMTTDLKLRNHGVLIVGGPRYEEGMLIISIGADCRSPRPRTADLGAAPLHPHSATPQAAAPE